MAFPANQGSPVSSSEAIATTTHTIGLPTGVVAGELLEASIAVNGETTCSWPAGWTERIDTNPASGTGSITLSAATRIADGSESGGSVVCTSAASGTSWSIAARINGHSSSTNAPTAATAVSAGVGDANPDPPNLVPVGGAKDYMWREIIAHDVDGSTFTPSTNYTTLVQNGRLSVAYRTLNAASENPGTTTQSISSRWVAATLAIHPGTEGIPTKAPAPPRGPRLPLAILAR